MESSNTLLSNSQDLHSMACSAIMPVTPLMATDILQVGRFCSSPTYPDQIWDPTSILLSEYQELFPRGQSEADHSLPHLKLRLCISTKKHPYNPYMRSWCVRDNSPFNFILHTSSYLLWKFNSSEISVHHPKNIT